MYSVILIALIPAAFCSAGRQQQPPIQPFPDTRYGRPVVEPPRPPIIPPQVSPPERPNCGYGRPLNKGYTIFQANPVECVYEEWCTQEAGKEYFLFSSFSDAKQLCENRLIELRPPPPPPAQLPPVTNCGYGRQAVRGYTILLNNPIQCVFEESCNQEQGKEYFLATDDGKQRCENRLIELRPPPPPLPQLPPVSECGYGRTKYTGYTIHLANPVECVFEEWCNQEPGKEYFSLSRYDAKQRCEARLRELEPQSPPDPDCRIGCSSINCPSQEGVFCGRKNEGECGCIFPPPPPPPPQVFCNPPCRDQCEQCVQVQAQPTSYGQSSPPGSFCQRIPGAACPYRA